MARSVEALEKFDTKEPEVIFIERPVIQQQSQNPLLTFLMWAMVSYGLAFMLLLAALAW